MKVIKYLIILNYAIRICISMKLYIACIPHNSEIPSLLYIKSVHLTDNCGGYILFIVLLLPDCKKAAIVLLFITTTFFF